MFGEPNFMLENFSVALILIKEISRNMFQSDILKN